MSKLQILGVVLVLAASPARADDDVAKAREIYLRGTKAFDLGLYDKAIADYMEAYQIRDDPAILYNIALAHRLAGHSAEAMRFYRRYLIKVPHAPNRDEVANKIEELRKAVEQQQKTQTMPPDHGLKVTPPDAPSAHAAPAPARAAATATVATATPANATAANAATGARAPLLDAHAGRTKKIAGLVVGAVGVAALAAGMGLAVVTAQLNDQVNAYNQNGRPWDPSKYSAGKSDQAASAAMFAVAGAAIVAGVVVYVLGHREGASRPRDLAFHF